MEPEAEEAAGVAEAAPVAAVVQPADREPPAAGELEASERALGVAGPGGTSPVVPELEGEGLDGAGPAAQWVAAVAAEVAVRREGPGGVGAQEQAASVAPEALHASMARSRRVPVARVDARTRV